MPPILRAMLPRAPNLAVLSYLCHQKSDKANSRDQATHMRLWGHHARLLRGTNHPFTWHLLMTENKSRSMCGTDYWTVDCTIFVEPPTVDAKILSLVCERVLHSPPSPQMASQLTSDQVNSGCLYSVFASNTSAPNPSLSGNHLIPLYTPSPRLSPFHMRMWRTYWPALILPW